MEPEPAKVLTSKKKKDIASPELGEENVPEITRLNVKFPKKEYVFMMNIVGIIRTIPYWDTQHIAVII